MNEREATDMRLIDADKLREWIFHNPWANAHDLLEAIHDQPTSYDVGKVLGYLEENTKFIQDQDGVNHLVIPATTVNYLVKAGGRNEV